MKRQILAAMALALTMPLVACGPTAPPTSAGNIATAPAPSVALSADLAARVAAVDARYQSARRFFDLLIAPLLPPAQLAAANLISARVELALSTARTAATAAARLAALRQAESAAIEFEGGR